jgi:predicted PurR-regulated permease PerM
MDDLTGQMNARFGDLITSINTCFDDVHRRLDNLVAHLARVQTTLEGRMTTIENRFVTIEARLESKASNWALGAMTAWITIVVSVATALNATFQ